MKQCDFCGQQIHKPSLSNHHDDRYCYDCNTDQFRSALNQIGAIVGMPYHVSREIKAYQEQIADLTAENTRLKQKSEANND